MSNARIYARNLAANWIGFGANLVVMFFLSPFVIHTLGLSGYGLWSTLNILVGYMGVLDLGIRASTGRHIILYVGRGDHQAVDETIRTSLGFFSAIGIGFFVVGSILGWAFPTLFPRVQPQYYTLLLVLLPVMGANLWVSMFRSVLSSVLTAHDRFDLARGLDLGELALRATGTVVTLNLGYGITGLVFVTVGCNIIGLFGTFLLASGTYPRLRTWPPSLLRPRLRELFSYGIPAAISAAGVKIIGQTDVIIISALIGFGAAGIYTTGANWLYYSTTLVGQIGHTFFPPLQRAVAKGEMGAARWIFFRQVRLALICGLPIFVGFVMFGKRFLYLWVYDPATFPHEAIAAAACVMAILAASKLLYLFCYASEQLLAAMGYVRFTAAATATEAVVNLALSIAFVLCGYGLVGVALGTLVARLVVRTFFVPYVACRRGRINWWRFLNGVWRPALIAGGLFAGTCYLVLCRWPTTSWAVFFLQVAVVLLCYVPIASLILVSREDLTRFRRSLAATGMAIYRVF